MRIPAYLRQLCVVSISKQAGNGWQNSYVVLERAGSLEWAESLERTESRPAFFDTEVKFSGVGVTCSRGDAFRVVAIYISTGVGVKAGFFPGAWRSS